MDEKKALMKQRAKKILKIIGIIAVAGLFAYITIRLLPWFISLKDEEARIAFQEYIHSKGAKGVFLLLGIQIIQVVVAFLPGEPIEILSGMLYGTFGGLALCLVGLFIGSFAVYNAVRILGRPLIEKMFKKEEVSKYDFLQNTAKIETMIFLLFFIPGTPKDILTYLAPFVKIKPAKFFLVATFARIPSVITSTYAGSSIMDGDWWQSVAMFLLAGALGLFGVWFNNRLMQKHNKKRAEKAQEKEQTAEQEEK